MWSDRTEAAIAVLRDADPGGSSRDELAALVVELRLVKSFVAAFEVRVARRTRELEAQGRSESAASLLGDGGRQSSREAAAAADRERVCDALPGFESALGSGAVSAGHVDAIAAATRNLDEEQRAEFAAHEADLLAAAERLRVEGFERACRELARRLAAADAEASAAAELERQRAGSKVKRWVDKVTGMHHTHLSLDPVRDAAVWSAIDAHLARLRQQDGNRRTPWAQLQVDAVVAAVSGGEAVARVPEISVLIDWATLRDGLSEGGVCETVDGIPVPVSTVRRLCCDGDVLPIVLGSKGEVLDVGRSERTATRAQRRALAAMHATCVHPGCRVPVSACRAHHVRWWWEHGGTTDLGNLVPVCESHHHLVHEGGWGLSVDADRVATWTRPDGTIWHTGPTTDRRPERATRPATRATGTADRDRCMSV